MKKLLVSSIAILSFASITAQASDEVLNIFNQLDLDQNGLVSIQEAEANPELTSHYARLDSNTDGQLTLSEFEKLTAK